MQPLIYSMAVSADGYIAGPGGDIGWSAPEPEIFRFHIDQTRELAGCLIGRSLYETMLVWETAEQTMADDKDALEFAELWNPVPKVVFSRTLTSVTGNARLATDDFPTELARLREQVGEGPIEVGGAGLSATAMAHDLIDEYRLFVYPIILGAGTPYFPPLPEPLDLRLVESRALNSRITCLRFQRAR
ncbi:dihydrofolate reductase [Nocardia sp. 2]|uniref:Dihydrofolate reductase n=1 Tax=Nocardia acididurans TaxID=2802282 RepID=A0ABS1M0R7_9NOCA|nr:dihydrofolate reductase family protein [Nocardia acididurans]MBL1074262.1 dihydrofolate reductase [Nocardia acididurans]